MRLIDADRLMNVLSEYDEKPGNLGLYEYGRQQMLETIGYEVDNAPTVDAVLVRHGRWIPYNSKYGHDEKVYLCDQCNNNVGFTKMNFCPNCGTDMRKDGDDGKAD